MSTLLGLAIWALASTLARADGDCDEEETTPFKVEYVIALAILGQCCVLCPFGAYLLWKRIQNARGGTRTIKLGVDGKCIADYTVKAPSDGDFVKVTDPSTSQDDIANTTASKKHILWTMQLGLKVIDERINKEQELSPGVAETEADVEAQPSSPKSIHEIFQAGQSVEYYSRSSGQWLPAQIKGSRHSDSITGGEFPTHEVLVGVRKQLRVGVELGLLRRVFAPGLPVSFYSMHKKTWLSGEVDALQNPSPSLMGYRVKIMSDRQADIPPTLLRARFPKDTEVEVYTGQSTGWLSGVVVEESALQTDVSATMPDLPKVEQSASLKSLASSMSLDGTEELLGPGKAEIWVEVTVMLDKQKLEIDKMTQMLRVPSYQVRVTGDYVSM
ncbi:unnamed protein product [Polarella glacialis]|uniref:Uncharacterized protein n=1 Tax=Polarella glacialis TaxID=89957 RepID=A0A813LTQ3_POLGL|nr:unnamed protein product [Polarella glacialis]